MYLIELRDSRLWLCSLISEMVPDVSARYLDNVIHDSDIFQLADCGRRTDVISSIDSRRIGTRGVCEDLESRIMRGSDERD